MNKYFNEFTDAGGRFIIKKQDDRTIVGIEIESGGKVYNKAFHSDNITMGQLDETAMVLLPKLKKRGIISEE